MEPPTSQPSTFEREEFFSGPAVYPPESVAPSHPDVCVNCDQPHRGHEQGIFCNADHVLTWFPKRLGDAIKKSSSAIACDPSVALAGQGGAGGGLRPLSAPAPEKTVRSSQFAAHDTRFAGSGSPVGITEAAGFGEDGCVLELSPADVLALKQEQDNLDRRNALLIELVFAARELARMSLTRMAETGITVCDRCSGGNRHAPGCAAQRVLNALAALEATADGGER